MSYYWSPRCETCAADGPKIRSGHSGLKFGPDHDASPELLRAWLEHHEYHDVRLRGEGNLDSYNPTGPAGTFQIETEIKPGALHMEHNLGDKPATIVSNEQNQFVFPVGVREILIPPHGAAVFVAEKPSGWYRLWCRITGRLPSLRWKYRA